MAASRIPHPASRALALRDEGWGVAVVPVAQICIFSISGPVWLQK